MNAELTSLALAAALALLLGIGIGVRVGLRLARRTRAALKEHAGISRLWSSEMPRRTAADILAGIIRVTLGGKTYQLPVLPRGAARRWLEALDARFASLASDLDKAGDDTPAIMVRLVAEADGLLDLLLEYDRAGNSILPERDDLDFVATDTEILRAVLEVWRAVNPLADTLAGLDQGNDETTGGTLRVPPTTPLRPMAGAQSNSTESPTSSSSHTSTPRRSGSSGTRPTSSSGSSKASGSAQRSSTTARRTPAGSPASALRPRSPRATAEG